MFRLFQTQRVAVKPALKLRNTLSGQLEEFKPLGKKVLMYNCGPTVYDFAQIGNLRSYIFADTLRRALDAWGYEVNQVINITDFGHLVSDADEGEDKMSKGLRREGLEISMENMRALAGRYMQAFLDDITAVGVDTKKATFPRASDYIKEQVKLIERLEEKGFAYRTQEGVYFDTSKYADYGKLGNINLSGQQTGGRVDTTGKKNPQDFVLWKPDAKLGWESPWGLGFPGWHTECVAMIFALLGEQIDIHTGGIDHIPVHHNNELAQAEAASGKTPFVGYWMHNAFLTIDDKRVGKSQGNAIVLKDVVAHGIEPRALRYWYLTAHYRSPVNFTWEALEGANTALQRLVRVFHELPDGGTPDREYMSEFYMEIAKDLDTPAAVAYVWNLIKNKDISSADKKSTLAEMDKILGLSLAEIKSYIRASGMVTPLDSLPNDIKLLAKERELARNKKDFVLADKLRIELFERGWVVVDTEQGQKFSENK